MEAVQRGGCQQTLEGQAQSSLKVPAPPCRYTVDADTVLDTLTGLRWQRASNPSGMTWQAAGTYCASLSLGGRASGWRLPTVKELRTLVDESASNPAIDTVAFPNTLSEFFWSSSPDAVVAGEVWGVNFAYGVTNTLAQGDAHRVRCVR